MKKIRIFLSEFVKFLEVKFSIYLNRRVFLLAFSSLSFFFFFFFFFFFCCQSDHF